MSTATKQNPLLALDANQATISTATVTIRTLRVNNKQLTQATFRQLPWRNLVDESKPEILGTIWGWVNYNPGCGDDPRSTQFIAQFGEELCRCPFHVRKVLPSRGCKGVESKAEYHRALAWSEFLHRALAEDEKIKAHKWTDNGRSCHLSLGHSSVFGGTTIGYNSSWGDPLSRFLNPRDGSHYVTDKDGRSKYVQHTADEGKELARIALIKAIHESGEFYCYAPTASLAEALEARDENTREAIAYARRWNDLMARLEAVPQLFIAV